MSIFWQMGQKDDDFLRWSINARVNGKKSHNTLRCIFWNTLYSTKWHTQNMATLEHLNRCVVYPKSSCKITFPLRNWTLFVTFVLIIMSFFNQFFFIIKDLDYLPISLKNSCLIVLMLQQTHSQIWACHRVIPNTFEQVFIFSSNICTYHDHSPPMQYL